MTDTAPMLGAYVSIPKEDLQGIFDALRGMGYTLVGPTLGEGAIIYDEIEGVDDLPIGWGDEQEAGTYRLRRRDDGAYFGYVVGPHSWKKYLYPPVMTLFSVERRNGTFKVAAPSEETPRYAFIGVRACELQAIAVQDRVFLGGPYQEPHYKAR
ncbi:MAG TPA: sulfite reductase subunit A, partial [Chloroflexi bacterium]|nr:sulfite reductase subunit A [Chloroflexota bacterium]